MCEKDFLSVISEKMQLFVALGIRESKTPNSSEESKVPPHQFLHCSRNTCEHHSTSPALALRGVRDTLPSLVIHSLFALSYQCDCISSAYLWIFSCLFPANQSPIYFPGPFFNAQTYRPWSNCLLIFPWINNVSEFLTRRQPSPTSSHRGSSFLF